MKPVIGKQIIDIITSGMYQDPLSVYREYLQNAADSIDSWRNIKTSYKPVVDIWIDGSTRTISIVDNGPGIPNEAAPLLLLSVGDSQKTNKTSRGFRGIGRLGGLAYCRKLVFETRANGSNKVCVVTWDGDLIRDLIEGKGSTGANDVIRMGTFIQNREATTQDKKSFFKVQLVGVNRFHDDILLNHQNVKRYLSSSAPVPYHPTKCSYGDYIESHLANISNYKTYSIHLNGEPIYKPYFDHLSVNGKVVDQVNGIETFQYIDINGGPLAYGWYAKTKLQSSFPKQALYRGITIRDGNIRVGDEYSLSDLFSEPRFATWHVGEIHVVNNKLKTNARRDGFEQTPEHERFIEQSSLLARYLSKLCRESSKRRSQEIQLSIRLKNLESQLTKSVLAIDEDHLDYVIEKINLELESLEQKLKTYQPQNGLMDWYENIIDSYDYTRETMPTLEHSLDGRTLWRKDHKELVKDLCLRIYSEFDKAKDAMELIEAITRPYRNTNN